MTPEHTKAPGGTPGADGESGEAKRFPQGQGSSALDLAFALLDHGIPVLVVRNGRVFPKDWELAVASQDSVARFRPGKDALVMVCGHGIDIVDEDSKNPGCSVANLPPFKSFGLTRTPSGGAHYVVPSSGLRTRRLSDVGDYQAGDSAGEGRGLVFLPGSVRPGKYPGLTYVEEVPWDVEGALAATADADLMLELGGDGPAREKYIDDSPERTEPGMHPYAETAIAGELARLTACQEDGWSGAPWDHSTYAVACRLIEFANSGWTGYTLDAAEADLKDRAPVDEGFGPREHEAKWSSALSKVGNGGVRPPDGAEVRAEPMSVGGIAERYPALDLAALLDPNRPAREWVVEGLLPAGASVALVAPAGSMKSLTMLAVALAVARGEPDFAGLLIPRRRRVVMVDMENTEDDLAERLRDLGATPADLAALTILHHPALPPLDTAKGGAELAEIVTGYGLDRGDVVLLDSIQRLVDGPENDADTYRSYYRHTALPLKRAGITLLRADNTGKDAQRGARGSSSKRDDVDIEFVMQRDGSTLVLSPEKVRIAVERVVIQVTTDPLTFSSGLRDRIGDVVRALDDLGLPLDAGWRAAMDALKDNETRSVVRQAVARRKATAQVWNSGPEADGPGGSA